MIEQYQIGMEVVKNPLFILKYFMIKTFSSDSCVFKVQLHNVIHFNFNLFFIFLR